jgi:hypothetical protein
MKIRQVGGELFHAGWRTDIRVLYMTKQTASLRSFANAEWMSVAIVNC